MDGSRMVAPFARCRGRYETDAELGRILLRFLDDCFRTKAGRSRDIGGGSMRIGRRGGGGSSLCEGGTFARRLSGSHWHWFVPRRDLPFARARVGDSLHWLRCLLALMQNIFD